MHDDDIIPVAKKKPGMVESTLLPVGLMLGMMLILFIVWWNRIG